MRTAYSDMTLVASLLFILAGLVHVGIFLAETLWWRRPEVWRAFQLHGQAAADDAAFFAFNQGFYNLFLAVAAVVGAGMLLAGASTAGWSLSVFGCTSMVAAALVLRVRGSAIYTRAAIAQASVPGLALIAAAIALA